MKTFKVVLAWILTVLAIVGVIAVLAGFVGSWVVRNKVTDVTVNLLTVGETAVSATRDSVNQVDGRLGESADKVMVVETRIVGAGDVLKDNSILIALINETIGDELAPALTSARETAVTVANLAFALSDIVEAVNEIPFVTLDGPGATLIQGAAEGIVVVHDDMTAMRTELVERREGRIEGGVDVITGYTSGITIGIQEVQRNLQAFDTQLAAFSTDLGDLKISLPRTYTLITLGVNLVLLLIGVAFVSLFLHSLSFIKNPDQTLNELIETKE
jgi:hypothetical protein